MKFRMLRHSTMHIIIMVVMALLLPILAYLQFQWLDRMSQWEQERIEASLMVNTNRFSEDFDRELSFLYRSFWLQLTPDTVLADLLWQRYANWRREARFPELLKTIHIYMPNGQTLNGLYKYLRGSKTFLQENWPQQLHHVESSILDRSGDSVVRGVFWQEGVAPVIVAPLSNLSNVDGQISLEQQHGWIILELDMNVMRKNILPKMVERYYAQGELTKFDIQIQPVGSDDIIYTNNPELQVAVDQSADASSRFFSILYRDLQLLSTLQAAAPQADSLYQNYPVPPIENHTGMLSQYDLFQRSLFFEELDVYAGDINFGRPSQDRALLWSQQLYGEEDEPEEEQGLWKITAVHKSGSLDKAISEVRNRNLAIAVGILIILGGSGGVLVFSARRARRLARQQMEFVAGVTHELRTPLTIIRAAGDNLADYVIRDTDQLQQYGRLIENQGRRLSDMVEKILLFSRIQSGHQEYRFSEIDPAEVINAALKDAQRLVEKHNTKIVSDIEPDLPRIRGDREALISVVSNLLANALKYGRSKKPVELQAYTRKEGSNGTRSLVVSVKDYGRGIPASEQGDIFRPFYRGESVRVEQLEGSGLGLSLVKQIVEAHSGEITLESRVNQGSAFSFTLPSLEETEVIDEKNITH